MLTLLRTVAKIRSSSSSSSSSCLLRHRPLATSLVRNGVISNRTSEDGGLWLFSTFSPTFYHSTTISNQVELEVEVEVEVEVEDSGIIPPPPSPPYEYGGAIEVALDSVVKIFTVASSPNYFLPWQNKSQRETMGSGFVLSGRRILTNAHVVADHTFVLVRKHGSPNKYRAHVHAIGHECDLAILHVDDPDFWNGMTSLHLGHIPFLQQAVAVVGYPQGGDNISVTKGVVSRVEPTQYVHGATQLMAIQIDAAINPGNSGGPAIMGDKVAGVAFQNLSGAENIGYIIPVPVIKHFISGVEECGKYVGFCSLGLSCQPTENVQLREYFRMGNEMTGVLVSKINPLSDAHRILKKDDIILAFDGVPIANDGTVPFRNRERITFDHLVSMKKPNETAKIRVLRDGIQYEFTVTLQPVSLNIFYIVIMKAI
ncbi:hypothetical protein AQUCO_05800005v1 [Aquilegia coerulea]|uniref:PDZ domain-containing protein n=2 Tax=Aquilegia coerulea TaxID=218851 RepID=A0A2G5CFF9_AQUCA|nr:hypothetical protein AQUCO_05800005v1 [Aquilegia coerulea]